MLYNTVFSLEKKKKKETKKKVFVVHSGRAGFSPVDSQSGITSHWLARVGLVASTSSLAS